MEPVDRVQYVHSVETNGMDYSDAVLTYFDQLMGIYGFIQPCNYTISIVGSSGNSLTLDMKFNDGESALKIANILAMSDKKMEIYQRMFIINISNQSIDTLRLTLTTQ